MNAGDGALLRLPRAGEQPKARPTIVLRRTAPLDDWLVCGVSAQLHQQGIGFDEMIDASHRDSPGPCRKAPPLSRPGSVQAHNSSVW